MAFVFKRPGSPCWYAGYTGQDGRQQKKSTGLRVSLGTKKAAETFAQKLEEAERRAAQGTITESRARMLLSDIVERTTGEAVIFHSVEEWLRTWLDGKNATKAPTTFESYKKVVEDFLSHLGKDRARRGIELVSVRDFQTFRDRQISEGKAPQTANNRLKKLRIPFNLARRQGLIPTNPAEAVEALPTDAVDRGTFTLEQLAALVACADGDWRGVILAGLYTGQRLRDITTLKWSAVDLAVGTAIVIQGKTKRRVLMPLHATFAAWLATHSAQAPATQTDVFPSLAGKKSGGAHGLSSGFKSIMQRAGIVLVRVRKRKEIKGRKGRDLFDLSFHSLRHTFNSILANGGVAQEIRQELTGHNSAAMNRVYTHHEIETFRGALKSLPEIEAREVKLSPPALPQI